MLLHAAAVMSVQIEICMVGEIKYGFPVTVSVIAEYQFIVVCQGITYRRRFLSGKSHAAVILQHKDHTVFLYLCLPDTFMVTLCSMAVQVIFTVIDIYPICTTVYLKRSACDSVRAGTDYYPEKARVIQIILCSVKPKHHIRSHTVFVRHKRLYQCRT